MASNQPQAGSAPEDAWIPFIQSMYPNLLQTTHFFPPLFFRQVPHTVVDIAGQMARVTVNPPPPPRGRSRQQRRARACPQPPPPPPAPSASSQPSTSSQSSSPAGTVFTDNPSGLQDMHIQDTDRQDDEAMYQCLQALGGINEVMMVISQMMFRKYLDNQHNFQQHINPTNIISQLPSISHPSIPLNIADGECDIIILHRQYGILVGEVKSVGGQYLSTQSPADQDQIIAKVVAKAINQLDNQEIALKHLVHDMAGGNIRVTKAPLLPNITSAQLTAAVNSSQQLQVVLCRSTCSQGVAQAVSRCLCADQLPQPATWWSALTTDGPDPSMTDTIYKRLVARFCGPASTVDIPTAVQPRKVLRAFGEAVAETALRFVSLVLTPRQVALLNRQPEPQYMYLQGPPGCGKTVILVLKALQWARRGKRVIVAGRSVNAAATILVEEQLGRMLGTAAAPARSIHRHSCDIDDVNKDVSSLVQLLSAGPDPEAFVLFDEVPFQRVKFIQWLTAVQHRLPSVRVWAASLYRVDRDPACPPPSWLEICTVTEPLRSPPAVSRQVGGSGWIDGHDIPRYSAPALPLPTEGPPVRELRHRGNEGHYMGEPWECVLCAETIGQLLSHDLCVGQPGAPHYRDTWILCGYLPDARAADVLVRRLRGHHRVPVRAVPRPPCAADARDLALALTDQVIVTDRRNIQGMERTVVIALGEWCVGVGADYLSMSRSTSFLCVIE